MTRSACKARVGNGKSSHIFFAAIAVMLIACCLPGHAQVVRVEAGASDMVPSQGGTISFQGQNYEGYLGAGELNGDFRLGSYVKTSIDSYQLSLGDQTIPFGLPTDILAGDQYYLTRGAGATLPVGDARLFLFGGATTVGAGGPLFQAFQIQTPLGMLFFDKPISDTVHYYSRNVFSGRQSFIQGVDWRPRKWFKSAFSAGTGSNKPYVATAAVIDRDWFNLKAAYIDASDGFRRVTTPTLYAAEPDRENVVATVKPWSSLVLTAGHENFVAPPIENLNAPFARVTVNQFQSSYDWQQFRLGAGIFESSGPLGHNVSDAFSVSRPVRRNIDASVSYYQTVSGLAPHTGQLVATVREKISPKISLLQVVNRIQGNTNFLFGGSYTVNRIAVSVDYETVYMPFLQNPFQTGIGVNATLKLWGNFQAHGQTFRSPDGRLRYTASLSTLLARGGRANTESVPPRMPGYVVRGHVRDVNGAPIEGAALSIGNDVVYTNAAGEFMVRERHSGSLPLLVLLSQFVNPLAFTVVAAPSTVLPAPEASAPDVTVILRVFQKGPTRP